ncbi:MAG: hypothetical protein DMG06_12945 [Acidobacteria bacterium]|nr:MAG: hypothetical protein DMG06_12945 [Acidobacteriota bacterium]
MLGMRKISSILTGLALLLQTSLPPLASSVQSDDPIGASGFIRRRQPVSPSSNQTTQTSRNFEARVCVPPDLVTNESWRYPYPGSEMDVFKSLLRDYILAHGDPGVQYRIKDQAFEIFRRARRASAPYTPDPRDLLDEVSTQQACPPTNYTNALEVGPDDSPPNPTAQPSAVKSPAVGKDPAERKCEELADMPYDPQKVGSGVPFAQINISEALPVCEQAATARPLRARYQYLYGSVLYKAERYAEAAQQYSMARSAGYAWGSLGLGMLNASGLGVPHDYDRAASLYREAANAGIPPAYYKLGGLYETGHGAPLDWGEATKCYEKAGDAGVAEGYAQLSTLYVTGKPQNYAEAAKWAQKAAQGGSPRGSLLLGWHYLTGNGVQKDEALAAKLYGEAARQGLPEAMYGLGIIYWVAKDLGTAAHWFHEAAQKGYTQAQDSLGNMFYHGWGVNQDSHAAFTWLLPAAQAGSARAQRLLGIMYDDGDGVTRNPAEAAAWYRKAAERDDAFAMTQLGVHLRLGGGVPWNEAEAMQWFRKAADKEFALAESSLGYGYMQGLGQDRGQGMQDYGQAAYWLDRAARRGDAAAQINLGQLYERGWGVDRDLQQAKNLYLQAARSPVPQYKKQAEMLVAALSAETRRKDDSFDKALPWILLGGAALLLSAISSSSGKGNRPADSRESSVDVVRQGIDFDQKMKDQQSLDDAIQRLARTGTADCTGGLGCASQ